MESQSQNPEFRIDTENFHPWTKNSKLDRTDYSVVSTLGHEVLTWQHFKNVDCFNTVEPVLSGHSKIDKTKILMTNGSLMKVESIAECSRWSILLYFGPALSDNWIWKPILVFFLSDRLRQVLLYMVC